nr:hypothetical protein [Cressdnaviricota sp.]
MELRTSLQEQLNSLPATKILSISHIQRLREDARQLELSSLISEAVTNNFNKLLFF